MRACYEFLVRLLCCSLRVQRLSRVGLEVCQSGVDGARGEEIGAGLVVEVVEVELRPLQLE